MWVRNGLGWVSVVSVSIFVVLLLFSGMMLFLFLFMVSGSLVIICMF